MTRNTMRLNLLAAALLSSGLVAAQTSSGMTTSPGPGLTTGTASGMATAWTIRTSGSTTTTTTGTGTGTGTTGAGTGTGTTGTGAGTTGTGTGTGTNAGADGTGTTATPTLSGGQLQVAGRVAAPFASFAGSTDNAIALATALRTGTAASLTSTMIDANGNAVTTTTTIMPPTKPMGWGNVSHALALARTALANAGITEPTAADLQAALVGGDVTTADGKTATLAGVLQQRAAGMGWGTIAKSYGTTMGAVNRALHSPPAATVTTTATASGTGKTAAPNANGTTGATARGITTAGGTNASSGSHGSKGLVTASGASAGTTVASPNGGGHAYGRGIVTASGAPATPAGTALHGGGRSGVVTAGGGSGTLKTAGGRDDHGNAQGHGKGGG